MTAERILDEYSDELSQEAKDILVQHQSRERNGNDHYLYVQADGNLLPSQSTTPGLLGGLEAHPMRESMSAATVEHENTYCVYECEWVEWDKENDRLTRHEGVKIGSDIYIVRGESKNIIRSVSNPTDCTLTVNGLFFSDKNGDPFSIVLSTMDLQD